MIVLMIVIGSPSFHHGGTKPRRNSRSKFLLLSQCLRASVVKPLTRANPHLFVGLPAHSRHVPRSFDPVRFHLSVYAHVPMKPRLLVALLTLGLFALLPAHGQAPAPAPAAESSITTELKALVARVQAKLQKGQGTAADLAEELGTFDTLFTKYRGQKTDDVGQILFVQATLYGQVLNDLDRARQLLQRVHTEFPDTKIAAVALNTLASIDRALKAKDMQSNLVGRPAPELHFAWASREGLKTLGGLKGKVVVLDFWATWCGPCIASFPQVRELAAHYKGTDVEVVGVTSLQGYVMGMPPGRIDTRGDPKREMELMTDFIKAKDMTWPVVFSTEAVFNPDYGVTGIPHMAIIAPDGTLRHTGLHPAMPHAEKVEKIDALLKEFGLKLPAASASKG